MVVGAGPGEWLAEPDWLGDARPAGLLEVVRWLTLLQIDPVAAIAPSADLIAWSRLGPAYAPGNRIRLYAPERCAQHGDVRAALDAQMRAPHFPVGLDAMRAELSFGAVAAGAELAVGAATVQAAAARHPNGCLAYRLSAGGRSVVYATDTEHDAGGGLDGSLLALARGADVLIYDAQYTVEEYAGKRGWGHSTAEEGARLVWARSE